MNALQYIKNVVSTSGKQLVFDTVGEYLPGTTAFATESADLAKELYTNVKDFAVNPMDNRIVKEYSDIGKDFVKDFRSNLFEDLKTGKWYNDQRETDSAMDLLNEQFGGGFGDDVWGSFDDDDFGDWEFEDDDEGGESSSTMAEMSQDKANTAAIIMNEQLVGERVANTVAAATVNSADYIVKSGAKSSKALFSLNKTGFSQMNAGMAAINANISNLVALGEPLTTHIQNSAAFYASSTEYQNKVLERLEAIQNAITLPDKNRNTNRPKTISDFLTDNMLDIRGYLDFVTSNVKSITSLFIGGDSGTMVKTMLNNIKTSPLHFMLSTVLKSAIPEAIKKSAKYFEDAIGHFWIGALDKMRNVDFGDSPLGLVWDFVKDAFIPSSGHKKKIDTSKYNREAMHWDGEAKQALTYVIPRQLGEIITLLGGTSQIYDYKKGQFKSTQQIKKDWKTESYNAAIRGGGDYFSGARKAVNAAAEKSGYSKDDIKRLQDQLDLYNEYIFNNANDETSYRVNSKNYKNSKMYDKIQKKKRFNEDDFVAAMEFLEMYNDALNQSHEGRLRRNSYRSSIVQERENRGRILDMYGEEGSLYTTLFDEFKSGGTSIKRDKKKKDTNISANGSSGFITKATQLIGLDDRGNDIWFYLQGIYLNGLYVRENFGALIPTKGKNKPKLRDVEITKNNRKEDKTNTKNNSDKEEKRNYDTSDAKSAIDEYVNRNIVSAESNSLEGLSREVLDYASVKEAYESNMKEGDLPFNETPDYNPEYEKIIKAHGGVKKLKKSLKGKIMQNQTINSFFTKMNKYLKMPEEVMDKITAGVEASTMRSLYGKDSNPNKGVFQVIQEGFTTLFGKLGSFLDEIFPPVLTEGVKTLWKLLFGENIGDKEGTHEGGLFSGLFNATKGAFRNAGNWFMGNNDIPDMGEISASGSGLLGISGGASRRQKKKNKKNLVQKAKNVTGKVQNLVNANNAVQEAKDRVQSGAENLINEAKQSAESGGLRRAMDFLGESVGQLANGVMSVANAIIPDSVKNGKKFGDEEKKKVASGVETLGKEMGLHKGNMGMGAVIGAGASLLTGAIIGPVAGAAIGAGVGLVASSEKVQNMLFGTKDERDAEPDKFMHKVGNWIDQNKKALGISAKGATIGTMAGAFLGNPILGTVLGGAVGFASSSESAQKWLFGDEEKDGVIPKEVQQMIKDRLPGIGAGALAGLMFGPLPSLPANIILGSALGFAAKSNKVQDWLFGAKDEKDGKRKGGALGWLKENIGNPIVGIFDKLSESIKVHIRNIGDDLKKMTRAFITKLLAGFVRGPLKALANSKVGQAVVGGAKAVASAPFKLTSWGLKRINTGLEKGALRKGYSIKSRELGRNLNMRERANLRKEDFLPGNTKIASMENYIDNLKDFKELDAFDEELTNLLDPSGKYTDEANKMRGGIRSDLVGLGGKNDSHLAVLQKVYEMANEGKSEDAIKKYLDKRVNAKKNPIPKELADQALEKVKPLIDKRAEAKNAKIDRNSAVKDILGRSNHANALTHKLGIDRLSDAQIRNLKDLVKDEKAYRKLEAGKITKAKEEEAGSTVTTNNLLGSITQLLATWSDAIIYGKKKKKKGNASNNSGNSSEEGGSKGGSSDNEPKEGDTKVDEEGRKWIFTNGEWVIDLSDSETHDKINQEEEERNAIKDIAKNTSILGTLGGLLSGIKEKLFGSKEKDKKGLFGNLLDLLTGKAKGVLSFLGNFFSGAKDIAGQFLVKAIGSNGAITASSVIANVLGPALLIGGFKGWFDKIFKKIGLGYDGTPDDGNDRNTVTIDPVTGEQNPTKQEKQNGTKVTVDAKTGEKVDPNSIRSLKSDKDSFSTALKKNTARGLLTGTKSVASVILGNTNVGKAISKSVAEHGGGVKGIVKMVGDQIDDILPKIGGMLKKIPILKNYPDAIDNFIDKLAFTVADKVDDAAAKLSKFAGNFVVFAKVAFIVADFTTGYEDASTTLKVKDPSTGERILCGIIRVLKNCIPVLGTIIPDDVIVDLFVNYIGPFFGMENNDLKERREEYQAEIDKYNEENGTNLTVAQYNKQVRHDFTWTERVGNWWNTAITQTKEAYNQAKADGKTGTEAVGAGIAQFVKGFMGSFPETSTRIFKHAMDGDIAGVWKEKLEGFSKQNENQAEVGLFSSIVGEIPIFIPKLIASIMVPFASIGKWIGEKLAGPINAFKKAWNTAQSVNAVLWEKAKEGHPLDVIQTEFKDEEGDPIGGFLGGTIIAQKLVMAVPAIFFKFGNWLGEKLAPIKEGIINKIESTKEHIGNIATSIKEGNVIDLWKNIMLGSNGSLDLGDVITLPFNFNTALFATIPTVAIAAGKKIGEFVSEHKETFIKLGDAVKDKFTKIKDNVASGNVVGLWKEVIIGEKPGLEDLGGLSATLPTALLLTIPTLISGAVIGIKKYFDDVGMSKNNAAEKYKTGVDNLQKVYDSNKGFTRLTKLWAVEDPNAKNDTGMGALYRIGFTVKKTFMTIGGVVNSIFGAIGDAWDSLKEKLGNAWDTFKSWFSGGDEVTLDSEGNVATISGGRSGLVAGSSFISQRDPRYRNMQMGGNNVGLLGCGPATAAMAANDLGKHGNMRSAVALASRYQTANGTDAAYFADYAARNGMKATYYVAGSSMIDGIRAGHPTVLMGQDPYNDSKANSPFGPNNHYVVAKGIDGHGNIIVQDPELQGTRAYSPAILKSVKMGVGLSGGAATFNAGNDMFNNTANDKVGKTVSTFNDVVNNTSTKASSIPTRKQLADKNNATKNDQAGYQGSMTLREGDLSSKQGNVAAVPKNSYNLDTSALAKQAKATANSTGASEIATDNPSIVWAILRSKGLSEAAVAGILGNMQAESGVDPTKKQYGGGPGRGLCQWESSSGGSGRFDNLVKFAQSRGKDWTDIESQVEFLYEELRNLSSTYWGNTKKMQEAGGTATNFAKFCKQDNVEMATRQFEGAFERGAAKYLHMETRIAAAVDFYNRFTGKNIVYDGSSGTYVTDGSDSIGAAAVSGTSGSSGEGEEKKYGILDIPSIFSDVFNDSVAKLFGGKTSSTHTGSSGSEHGGNGATYDTSIASSLGSGATPVDYMKSILGKISYSMKGPRDPEKGSADCSSTVAWAVRKATGLSIGGNTPSQYANTKDLTPIWHYGGTNGSSGLPTSIPDGLQPNDILFFSRPNSDFTSGRKDRIGHVGIYEGDGKFIDHGSGTGTKEKMLSNALSTSNGGLIGVSRITGLTNSTSAPVNVRDNPTKTVSKVGQSLVTMSAMGSGLDDFINDVHQIGTSSTTSNAPSTIRNQASVEYERATRSASTSNKATLVMMRAMLEVIESVVKNTNNIDKIYEVLVAMANKSAENGVNTDEEVRRLVNQLNTNSNNSNPEDSFSALKTKVDQLMEMA